MKHLLKSKSLAIVVATLGVAALLGGSLGVVMASVRSQPLSDFNLAGGPLNGDIAPDQYIACLPPTSWNAVYIWDGVNQTWLHFFNSAAGVPAYVNAANSGGISAIPRFSGVVILMNLGVSSPRLKDSASEACTP